MLDTIKASRVMFRKIIGGKMAGDRLLRVEQVAELTGWRPATIRAKILKRELPYVKLGRSVRISESIILRLIAESTIPARPRVQA